jgi:hypothetical protein
MQDGINKEIENTKGKIRRISASEVDLILNIEKLFRKTINEIEEYHPQQRMEHKGMSLITRYTIPFTPSTLPQDIEFPAKDKLAYENYLVAILDAQTYV